ncbi:MAG TPA: hypothetical protein VID24_13095 [Candidatus Eremiobacteraceae bacterium]|jgi:hypothetical protein
MIVRERSRPWRLTTRAVLLINFLLTAAYALAAIVIGDAKSPPVLLRGASDWRFTNHLDAVRAGDALVLSVAWVAALSCIALAHLWTRRVYENASIAGSVRSGILVTVYIALSPLVLDPTNLVQDVMGIAIMGGALAALFATTAVAAPRGLGVFIFVGLAGTAVICAFTDVILGFGLFCC